MTQLRVSIQSGAVVTSAGSRECLEDDAVANFSRGIFAVSDGFGGPTYGLEAAKTACASVREFLEREAGDEEATMPFERRSYYSLGANILLNSLRYANQRVLKLNRDRNVHEKGGASLLAGYLDGTCLSIGGAGTCRAILIREGRPVEILRPRSYQSLMDPRSFPANLKPSDFAHVPLMALGISQDLEPEITEVQVRPGDGWIFSSDGLTEDLLGGVVGFFQAGLSPEEISERFQRIARAHVGEDNLSILLAVL